VDGLFQEIEASGQNITTTMQYVEIYNEVVKDLLDPAPKMTNLDVRENPHQGTFVAGAATVQVRVTPGRLHSGCSWASMSLP
jgi:hypothetical protein